MGQIITSVSDILNTWNFSLRDFYSYPFNPKDHFLEIKIRNKNIHSDIGEELDWWPKGDFDNRVDAIKRLGLFPMETSMSTPKSLS